MAVKSKEIKGYISKNKNQYTEQSFSGEVSDKMVTFPKELGVEHPFKFEDCELVYKKYGLVNGAINKYADTIVGEFSIECKNPNVLKLVKTFVKDNCFSVVLREWIREGLMKGNGFMEIDLQEGLVRVLNANNMYVKRTINGDVKEYIQWTGDMSKVNRLSNKFISFKPEQIAHLKVNAVAGEAYGLGLIWPNEITIENMAQDTKDSHQLMSRKAGAPIHVKIGQPGEVADPAAIDAFSTSLQYMNTRTEWVTDGNVEMKAIDFAGLGDKLTELHKQDFQLFVAGFDIPEVLLNSGQLNEGIAKVQLEGFHSKIISYQDMIESVIVNKIFNPWLVSQGMNSDDLDFIWNIPSQDVINMRIDYIARLMNAQGLSDNMKQLMELEVARLLNIDDAEEVLGRPDPANAGVRTTPMNPNQVNPDTGIPHAPPSNPSPQRAASKDMPVPKVPGAKPQMKAGTEINEKPEIDIGALTIKEFMDLKEMKGFTYSDYTIAILKAIKADSFEDLKAVTEQDVQDGLFPDKDIEKLRTILKDAFRNNLTMRDIETKIRDGIDVKDRIYEKTVNGENIKVTVSADTRPENIARTEVARLSNQGLVDLYVDNGIKKMRWAASWQENTCDYCRDQLDGQVVNIGESFTSDIFTGTMPPAHNNCNCSVYAE